MLVARVRMMPVSMSRVAAVRPLISPRPQAGDAPEHIAEMVRVLEAQPISHLLDRASRISQVALGLLDPPIRDVLPDRRTGLRMEQVGKIIRRQSYFIG